MEENIKDSNTYKFPANEQGKGAQLTIQLDSSHPEHSERMAELLKEVSESNPKSIAAFLIRMNEIDKL